MSLKDFEPDRSAVVFSLPIIFGFVIDISAGTLLAIGGVIAVVYGQMVYRHGEAKARAHKLWIEAQNASLQPQLDHAHIERAEMQARLRRVEDDLAEAIKAERDLALASLELSGTFKPKAGP